MSSRNEVKNEPCRRQSMRRYFESSSERQRICQRVHACVVDTCVRAHVCACGRYVRESACVLVWATRA